MQKQFNFQPSHFLAAVLITAHGATIAALVPLDFPMWAKMALTFLILFSLTYHLQREALLTSAFAAVGLMLEGDQVILTLRNGEQRIGKILHDSLVTPYLTVLNVLPQGSRLSRSVVVLPGSLDAESFRQLRIHLKWGHQQKPDATL
ncbi:MAG: protein YgfX [Nitrosomonadales bacterium]